MRNLYHWPCVLSLVIFVQLIISFGGSFPACEKWFIQWHRPQCFVFVALNDAFWVSSFLLWEGTCHLPPLQPPQQHPQQPEPALPHKTNRIVSMHHIGDPPDELSNFTLKKKMKRLRFYISGEFCVLRSVVRRLRYFHLQIQNQRSPQQLIL